MNIIGITGTLGAGKGTIVDYLVKEKGYAHFSVRSFLTSLIEKRGLEVNRDNMVSVANDLREKYSPSYIAEQLFEKAKSHNKNAIIESIRTVGEIEALKALGNCIILAIDADQKLRYERIVGRASATDSVSFKEFVANEEREMNSTDPNRQNLSACMQMADIRFNNNGSFEELHQQIEEKLEL